MSTEPDPPEPVPGPPPAPAPPNSQPADRDGAACGGICPICGDVLIGIHCKLVCPNCGYREDCSDLFPS